MYIVQCSLYTVYCTIYIVHSTLYTVQNTLYTVHCTLYTVNKFCSVHYTVYKHLAVYRHLALYMAQSTNIWQPLSIVCLPSNCFAIHDTDRLVCHCQTCPRQLLPTKTMKGWFLLWFQKRINLGTNRFIKIHFRAKENILFFFVISAFLVFIQVFVYDFLKIIFDEVAKSCSCSRVFVMLSWLNGWS